MSFFDQNEQKTEKSTSTSKIMNISTIAENNITNGLIQGVNKGGFPFKVWIEYGSLSFSLIKIKNLRAEIKFDERISATLHSKVTTFHKNKKVIKANEAIDGKIDFYNLGKRYQYDISAINGVIDANNSMFIAKKFTCRGQETLINADSLMLNARKKTIVLSGNVELTQYNHQNFFNLQ